MDDIEVVDIPGLEPLFTVGCAEGYAAHGSDLLMVSAGSAAYDDVACAAITEQAELFGFPYLADMDIEEWENSEGAVTRSVELWFSRSLSDALVG